MGKILINEFYSELLKYIVSYRRLRGKASRTLIIQQLIMAYAKQLVAGMPEALWRKNMLLLIQQCEEDDENAKETKPRKKSIPPGTITSGRLVSRGGRYGFRRSVDSKKKG